MSDLASAILASAQRLGIDPRDLATAISYETAGTFDPWKAGPTTQWGQHRGLIQWGEPQRAKYGVSEGMPVDAQMQAAERYLTDAGVKPGMGLLDVYSAINAGRVGRYGASDANNGGAPGTVADKVNSQMAGHRKNAEKLLGGMAPSGVPQQMAAPGKPAPKMAFGDFVAPQEPAAPADLGSLMASMLQTRQRGRNEQAEAAEAEQAKRAALLSLYV